MFLSIYSINYKRIMLRFNNGHANQGWFTCGFSTTLTVSLSHYPTQSELSGDYTLVRQTCKFIFGASGFCVY